MRCVSSARAVGRRENVLVASHARARASSEARSGSSSSRLRLRSLKAARGAVTCKPAKGRGAHLSDARWKRLRRAILDRGRLALPAGTDRTPGRTGWQRGTRRRVNRRSASVSSTRSQRSTTESSGTFEENRQGSWSIAFRSCRVVPRRRRILREAIHSLLDKACINMLRKADPEANPLLCWVELLGTL